MGPQKFREPSVRLYTATYLEMRHEPGQIQHVLRTPDVNVDGRLQFLIEPDSCCNVEHNVHFLTEHLTVIVFDTQVGQPAVTRYKSHFVYVVGTGLLHEVEQLNRVYNTGIIFVPKV